MDSKTAYGMAIHAARERIIECAIAATALNDAIGREGMSADEARLSALVDAAAMA